MRTSGPISIALSLLMASTAHAQATTPEAAPQSAEVAAPAGEIIVTAQRRAESLQDTPMAVTAVTASVVQTLGLGRIQDIAAITPGASFTTNTNFFAPYIRGIGTNYVSVGLEAPVAIYEDGAYLVRTLGMSELLDNFDLGSIQVLRGPQGTLYGRNATGGVILVNSADPKQEFEGRVRGEYGNLDHYSLHAMINTPLNDDLALRVSGGYRHEGHFMRAITPGEPGRGGGRTYSVRGKLKWTPGSADITLGGQYYDLSYNMGLTTLGRDDDTCFACVLEGPGLVPADRKLTDYTGALSQNRTKVKNYGADLNMKFDLGSFQLSSVTTYRHQAVKNSIADADATPAYYFEFKVPHTGGTTVSQDFQISSQLDGPLDYLFGLSYLNDKSVFNPCLIGIGFGNSTGVDDGFCADNTMKTKSYAAFAEAYYQLSDNLKVTVGGRYTYEERTADVFLYAFPAFGIMNDAAFFKKTSQRAFTPRFVLAWDNGPTNAYYSFTRGFKAGGMPGAFFGAPSEVGPEKIFSHEVGVKHSMLDNRLRVNAAAFYYKNKDNQVATLDPTTTIASSVNAGALENYGLELELQATPVEGLNLGLTGAWQHARYKPFENASLICYDPANPAFETLVPCSIDLTGTQPAHAPDWSGSFNASYEFPVGAWTAQIAGLARYSSPIKFFAGAGGNLNYDRMGKLFLVNASGYVSPPGGNLRIGFYANNVFNKKYVDYRQTTSPWGLSYNPAKPRTYGMRVDYSF